MEPGTPPLKIKTLLESEPSEVQSLAPEIGRKSAAGGINNQKASKLLRLFISTLK